MDRVIAQSDASRFMLRRVRVEFPNSRTEKERTERGFPIESPPVQEAECSTRAPPSARRGAGRCTFMPVTSHGAFRQRHDALRKSCYAINAHLSTFQFRQRAIV